MLKFLVGKMGNNTLQAVKNLLEKTAMTLQLGLSAIGEAAV